MSWEYEVFQIRDEIEDMSEARTSTKYNHSKKQLLNRVKRLKEYWDDMSDDNTQKNTLALIIKIGQDVYDGKMGDNRGLWAIDHLEEYAEEGMARMTAQMERKSETAMTLRGVAVQLGTVNKAFDELVAAGGGAGDKHRIIEAMRRELAKDTVVVALQAAKTQDKDESKPAAFQPGSRLDALVGEASPIPGLSRSEWRTFKTETLKAEARVAVWDATQAEHAEEAVATPTLTLQMAPITMHTVSPLGISAGRLALTLQEFEADPAGVAETLAATLEEARGLLAASPSDPGAPRLTEVIGQVEAVVAGLMEPAAEAEHPQDLPVETGPNWLLIGGAVGGLALATTATVLIVKKVRSKKKRGK